MATAATLDSTESLIGRLREALGGDNVLTDEAERRFYSTDVYNHRELPVAVARPGSVAALQAAVRACAAARAPLTVRGGGASYTDGYLHSAPGGVTIDTARLDRIDVDAANAVVTVEAGVTWAALHEALAARGLRTPFWGPFSGLAATVGGSMSQNAISHGTGAFGVSAESVIGFDIVTGTGELLSTGAPHFRFFGPDLAGLFTGDCGALGVKARIRLKLIRRHEASEAASFSFDSFDAMHGAMRAIALEHLDDENFGLDAALQQGQIGRQEGASAKAQIAKSVLASAPSLASGVKALARMAAAGDRALRQANYVVHYIADGVDAAAAGAKIAAIRRIGGGYGVEIANSVPTIVRGMPFAPLTNILGPKGERWVPMHALLAHDRVASFHAAITALWDSRRDEMDALGVYTGAMFMAVGASAFVYEPAFYWPDEQTDYHRRTVPTEHQRSITTFPGNEPARALIAALRAEVAELMHAHGGAHLQIGKAYPYLRSREPASLALLRAVKAELDPHGILNPGALGL